MYINFNKMEKEKKKCVTTVITSTIITIVNIMKTYYEVEEKY